MSADFWAGYIAGAAGIIIGNPLDLIKTRLQASGDNVIRATSPESLKGVFDRAGVLVRGTTAPVLTYGALNALLYVTYNRSLAVLNGYSPTTTYTNMYLAGVLGGIATFVVSTPTEIVKVRAQTAQAATSLSTTPTLPISRPGSSSSALPFSNTSIQSSPSTPRAATTSSPNSSLAIATQILKSQGIPGFYRGGTITLVRDAVGYGFYFCVYEACKGFLVNWPNNRPSSSSAFVPIPPGYAGYASDSEIHSPGTPGDGTSESQLSAWKILLAGGIAGVVSWTSIFPLDVVKTRVQSYDLAPTSQSQLPSINSSPIITPNEHASQSASRLSPASSSGSTPSPGSPSTSSSPAGISSQLRSPALHPNSTHVHSHPHVQTPLLPSQHPSYHQGTTIPFPSQTSPPTLSSSSSPLSQPRRSSPPPSTLQVALHAYRTSGPSIFFRGLSVCSVRAFIVNAVQWAVYEWCMVAFTGRHR